MSREKYTTPLPEYSDLFTVAEFKEAVRCGMFNEYDGSGFPAKRIDSARIMVSPRYIQLSRLFEIPEDATHVAWFNK